MDEQHSDVEERPEEISDAASGARPSDEAENACEDSVIDAVEEADQDKDVMEEDDANQPKDFDQGEQVFTRVLENLQRVTGLLEKIFVSGQEKHGLHQQRVAHMTAEVEQMRSINDQEEINLENANVQFNQSCHQLFGSI